MQEIAVAVKYNFDKDGDVPKVVASGRGMIARRIVKLAQEADIPIKEEKELAESLAKIPVGVEIPAELWEAVATILAHIYQMDHPT
ncbi:MAG: EscU/YscU/HrcU family type III secretion system export apparatus switch protein [Candidatus Riflebacteria bacterium]|nr:EscU/YscU/HrcU family type III secretion system export apparatus switch protein [Candidatus Riflebacteria bacterium]